MKRHRVLIVDDEPPARARLRALVAEQPDFEAVGECADGPEAIARLRSEPHDLVLLDVRMPGCSGFDVVRAVGAARLPPVVFITAYDEHALEAFELEALDYLLKPVDRERFTAALARSRREILERRGGRLAARLEALLARIDRAREAGNEALVLRERGRTLVVEPREIEWIEAADNYLRVHAGAREHLVRGTLGAMEERLAPHGFLRIHRSLLVNPDVVRELCRRSGGEVELLLRGGVRLVSSRQYRRAIESRWPR